MDLKDEVIKLRQENKELKTEIKTIYFQIRECIDGKKFQPPKTSVDNQFEKIVKKGCHIDFDM